MLFARNWSSIFSNKISMHGSAAVHKLLEKKIKGKVLDTQTILYCQCKEINSDELKLINICQIVFSTTRYKNIG